MMWSILTDDTDWWDVWFIVYDVFYILFGYLHTIMRLWNHYVFNISAYLQSNLYILRLIDNILCMIIGQDIHHDLSSNENLCVVSGCMICHFSCECWTAICEMNAGVCCLKSLYYLHGYNWNINKRIFIFSIVNMQNISVVNNNMPTSF